MGLVENQMKTLFIATFGGNAYRLKHPTSIHVVLSVYLSDEFYQSKEWLEHEEASHVATHTSTANAPFGLKHFVIPVCCASDTS